MGQDGLSAFTEAQLEGIYGVAHGFLERGDLATALHAFRVMVRFAPSDERGWLGLGSCHMELAEEEVAGELFGAGALVSRSVRCLIALSRLRTQQGDRRGAADLLVEARRLAEEIAPDLIDSIDSEKGALS